MPATASFSWWYWRVRSSIACSYTARGWPRSPSRIQSAKVPRTRLRSREKSPIVVPPSLVGAGPAAPVLGAQAELADLLLQALAHHADRLGGARHVAAAPAQRREQEGALEAED